MKPISDPFDTLISPFRDLEAAVQLIMNTFLVIYVARRHQRLWAYLLYYRCRLHCSACKSLTLDEVWSPPRYTLADLDPRLARSWS